MKPHYIQVPSLSPYPGSPQFDLKLQLPRSLKLNATRQQRAEIHRKAAAVASVVSEGGGAVLSWGSLKTHKSRGSCAIYTYKCMSASV